MNYAIESSWCLHHFARRCEMFGVGVQLGGLHLCLRCACREVGVPEGSTAEQVVAEASRLATHKEVA